ncbi:MAG: hypothetical protein RQ824_02755 [bacterium]|nr:hypothetical protein [bacterium]
MIKEDIDELVEYISASGREADVAKAKEEYFRENAGIFGDEESYDMRIGSFLEWYLIDRMIGGKSLLEEYAESVDDPEKRAKLLSIRDGLRSIFEMTGVYDDRLYLKELISGKKYIVMSPFANKFFKSKNILDCRIFKYDEKRYTMSESYFFHPEKAKKIIVSKLKEAAALDKVGALLNSMANMSLKWERYRNFKVEEIYK